MFWLGLTIGLIIGFIIGLFASALFTVSKQADQHAEAFRSENWEEEGE